MAYIGRSVDIGMFEKQILTPNNTTTTFDLTFAVGSANSLLVVYGGVVQEPQVAYSVSGGGQQIVFSVAPATGTPLYIIYYGKQLTTLRAAGQETTKQTFTGDGSTVTYTLTDPPVVPSGIMVFVDGILQREGSGNNYVSSGSTFTFTSAPDSSAEIDVYTLVKEKVSIDTVADRSITFAKLVAGSPTWNGAGETVIATASTGNSLRITNTGSGNSLLVEDSTNPDSTPFVIDNAGNVLVGTTTAYGTQTVARPNAGYVYASNSNGNNSDHFLFTNTGTTVGSITRVGGTGVAYNTSSDYRLKESVSPMQNALTRVVSLKPVTYKWKVDGSDGEGFIAHELQAVVPNCVVGEKDAVNAEGKPVYQCIDTSFLVATLTAAIQEQQALITALTARITAAGI